MKFGLVLNFWIAIFMGGVLALLLPYAQGAPHVDLLGGHGYLASFAVAAIASFIIPTVIPLARIAQWCVRAFNTTHDTTGGTILFLVFMNTFMTLGLALVMTVFMTGFEALGPTTIFDRYVSSIILFWPVVNVVFLLIYPFVMSLTKRFVQPPGPPSH